MNEYFWCCFSLHIAGLLCSSEVDDLADGFFIHMKNAEKGVFPRLDVSEQSFKARSQAAKMFGKVMNGLVAPDDPMVSVVENLTAVLLKKQEEVHLGFNLNFPLPKRLSDIFYNIEFDTYLFVNRALETYGYVRYNGTVEESERFAMRCRSQKTNDGLISQQINWDIGYCRSNISEEGKARFVELLAEFPHPTEIPIETQLELAFIAATTKTQISEIIARFFSSWNRMKTYYLPKDKRLSRAIREQGKYDEYENWCFLDVIYCNNLCNKTKLAQAIAKMETLFYSIEVINTVSVAYYGSDSIVDPTLRFVDQQLIEARTIMDEYYQRAIANSFQLCEPTIVRQKIEQFSTGPIAPEDYQALGDKILKEVQEFGRPEIIRHIVVTPNIMHPPGLNYFFKGFPNRTSVIHDDIRKVTIFDTYHEVSRDIILNQESFMNRSKELIDHVMKDYYRSNNIEEITKQLSARNISLTAPGRFGCELWIRESSYTGDCSIKDSISFEGSSSAHHLLTYKWRNHNNPFRACEAYHIYMFP